MLVNNDVSQAGARNFEPHYTNSKGQAAPALGWKELKPTSRSKGKRRRRILAIASAVLLISLIFTVLRVASIASGNNDQLTLTVGSQQGAWLDFMSNPKSTFRGKYARVPIHPVLLWSVGNEPDRLTDPDTGAKFLVGNYVKDFIAYSLQMHQNNPNIKVFGPEISQFYGIGSGPTDINGTPWMEGV